MKFLALGCVALLLLTAPAAAGEGGVARSTLESMGLGELRPLSDSDGLAVRGKGTFAGVWGGSTASWGGQTSTNNYAAGSSWLGKSSTALGGSLSFAGQTGWSSFFRSF